LEIRAIDFTREVVALSGFFVLVKAIKWFSSADLLHIFVSPTITVRCCTVRAVEHILSVAKGQTP